MAVAEATGSPPPPVTTTDPPATTTDPPAGAPVETPAADTSAPLSDAAIGGMVGGITALGTSIATGIGTSAAGAQKRGQMLDQVRAQGDAQLANNRTRSAFMLMAQMEQRDAALYGPQAVGTGPQPNSNISPDRSPGTRPNRRFA